MHEIDETRSIGSLVSRPRAGSAGILLNTQPNFAWLTGGRSNQIDGSRENGSGSLLVSARGERFVVANNIEMPRLQDEALSGLGFTPLRVRVDRRAGAARARRSRTREAARVPARSGATTRFPAACRSSRRSPRRARCSRRRKSIVIARSAATWARSSASVCRALAPDLTEIDIAQRAAAAVAQRRGAGDRDAGRRRRSHRPLPSSRSDAGALAGPGDGGRLRAASRAGRGAVAHRRRRPSARSALDARTAATASVFGRLLDATRPARTGRDLFARRRRGVRRRGVSRRRDCDITRAARPATVRASGSRILRRATRSKLGRRSPGIPASPARRSKRPRSSPTTGWRSSPPVRTGRRFRCRFGGQSLLAPAAQPLAIFGLVCRLPSAKSGCRMPAAGCRSDPLPSVNSA